MEQAALQAGIHRATLHRWENEVTLPRLSELNALLGALDASRSQKTAALRLLDAPRAVRLIRAETNQIAHRSNLAALPHGGDLLRAMRLRRGISLDEAAARVGVTGGTLRRWERREVWPDSGQLHRLCQALGAHRAETLALTTGEFARARSVWPDTPEDVPLDALEQRFADLYADRYALLQSNLIELSLLTLEAQVWPHAARSDAGRRLLARVYTEHAHVLSDQERHVEMGQMADRALDVAPPRSTRDPFWSQASVYGVAASVSARHRRGGGPGLRRAIERFQQLLPYAPTPELESWILAWLGECLIEDGAHESGLLLYDQACRVALRSADPIQRRLREGDKAQVLLHLQRPAEALEIIQIESSDNAYFRTGQLLKQAEAYLEMGGHESIAQDKLQQAYEYITAYDLLHFRARADALAQRL